MPAPPLPLILVMSMTKLLHLPEEVVLVNKPVHAVRTVWIGIDDSHASEVRGRLDDGKVVGVADQLRVVGHDERSVNQVCASREVDDRGCGGAAVAANATAIAVEESRQNGVRVVSDTVTRGAKVILDIAVELVGSLVGVAPDWSVERESSIDLANSRSIGWGRLMPAVQVSLILAKAQ